MVVNFERVGGVLVVVDARPGFDSPALRKSVLVVLSPEGAVGRGCASKQDNARVSEQQAMEGRRRSPTKKRKSQ